MTTVVLKFGISNKFSEWEQAFSTRQPTARAADIFALYHGHEPVSEQQVYVVARALSEQHMQKFMEADCATIAASGPILESKNSQIYVNYFQGD